MDQMVPPSRAFDASCAAPPASVDSMAPCLVELPDCAFRRPPRGSVGCGGGGRGVAEAMRCGPSSSRVSASRPVLPLSAAKRDVFELGSSGLGKRSRRVLDTARSEAFGVKQETQKMPPQMLLGIRRAEAKRDRCRAQELEESGVVATIEKRDSVLGGAKRRKRSGSSDAPLDDLKDGVFRVRVPGARKRAGRAKRC